MFTLFRLERLLTFNRTSMELKQDYDYAKQRAHEPFNRTSMELKLLTSISRNICHGF